jgi:hypothetical protein
MLVIGFRVHLSNPGLSLKILALIISSETSPCSLPPSLPSFLSFLTGSHYVAQTGFKLVNLLWVLGLQVLTTTPSSKTFFFQMRSHLQVHWVRSFGGLPFNSLWWCIPIIQSTDLFQALSLVSIIFLKESNEGSCVVFGCHKSSISFHLKQFLSLSLTLMTLTPSSPASYFVQADMPGLVCTGLWQLIVQCSFICKQVDVMWLAITIWVFKCFPFWRAGC